MSDYELVNKAERKGFSKALGYTFLNGAMQIAPYKTGNLASSIRLPINHWKHIQIRYDGEQAFYAGILDQPGGAHEGFIRHDTVMYIISAIHRYFQEGDTAVSNSFSWSKAFYDITQRKGYGRMGQQGDRYLVGRDPWTKETRAQRRQRSRHVYMRNRGLG